MGGGERGCRVQGLNQVQFWLSACLLQWRQLKSEDRFVHEVK